MIINNFDNIQNICRRENKNINLINYMTININDDLQKIKELITGIVNKEKINLYCSIKFDTKLWLPYLECDNLESLQIIKKIIFKCREIDTNLENIDSINLGKRNNSVLMNEPQIISFNLKGDKNDILNMQNIEDENDKNSYNIYEEKKNISNNLNEKTLSTVNHNKTISDKKRQSNIETEIIYPNISKNDSNILIDNNYSHQFKRNKSYHTLSNINYLISVKKTE
jgi:hypothetical protein